MWSSTHKIETIHRESRGTYGAPRPRGVCRPGDPGRRQARSAADARRAAAGREPTALRHDATRPDGRARGGSGPAGLPRGRAESVVAGRHRLYRHGRRLRVSRVVLDAWSRRIVGWALASHLRTELVMGPLDRALPRRPLGFHPPLRPRYPTHLDRLRAPVPRSRHPAVDGIRGGEAPRGARGGDPSGDAAVAAS